MAGNFNLLYSQTFTATDAIVVNHSLDRYQMGVIITINGSADSSTIISSIDLDSVDPRNSLTITLNSAQTGLVKIVDTDYSWANMPTPEESTQVTQLTSSAYSPGGADTQVQFNDGGSNFTGSANFTWLKASDTLSIAGDISGSGNVSGSFFYGDGSNLTNLPGITGPVSSVDKGIVVWNGTTGDTLTDTGLRNFGAQSSAPSSPSPGNGDTYYDTTINSQMIYDGTRSKWLSVESCTFQYGSNKDREDQYLYMPGNLQGNSNRGYATPLDATIVAIGYTRDDASDTPTFQARSNGSSVAIIASAANITEGVDSTINIDVSAVDHINGYVSGDKAKHPTFWVRLKWRR